MALDNHAVPKYYGMFRDAVIRGEIPVCDEVSMEMNRIDALIENPGIYYDPDPVEGFIKFCEGELTLTDGSDLHLLDSFKLWAEQLFGWYYFVERSVYEPSDDNHGGRYVKKNIKKRLITVFNSRKRRCKINVCGLCSWLLFNCRYTNHTPDHNLSYNEAVRRSSFFIEDRNH